MNGWTVTCQYFATGEGITTWLMYSFNFTKKEDVLKEFAERVDEYFIIGADIKEGIDLECKEAKLLLSEPIKKIIQEGGYGGAFYFVEAHFNYS